MQSLGAQIIDYSTWYDCCGFGFRHIISEREFTRSFAIDRKIKVAVDEANSDVMIGHDTGCITTLDKNQWIARADERNEGKNYDLPVIADIQFAALACGADPFKIIQSHWHASPMETLFEKMGIDWRAKKADFEEYLKKVEQGHQDNLYDPRRRITGGPGFIKPEERVKLGMQ
jgi:heterodisulfide reductase subunit B